MYRLCQRLRSGNDERNSGDECSEQEGPARGAEVRHGGASELRVMFWVRIPFTSQNLGTLPRLPFLSALPVYCQGIR